MVKGSNILETETIIKENTLMVYPKASDNMFGRMETCTTET